LGKWKDQSETPPIVAILQKENQKNLKGLVKQEKAHCSMDEGNREEKRPKAEDGAEVVGNVGIQKTRWQRLLQFPDTRAIVLITLIYTVFAGLQWCSIRESNRINQEALLTVQRAYVNFKTIESTGIRDAQGRIRAHP
jgi:hypothetical protein